MYEECKSDATAGYVQSMGTPESTSALETVRTKLAHLNFYKQDKNHSASDPLAWSARPQYMICDAVSFPEAFQAALER